MSSFAHKFGFLIKEEEEGEEKEEVGKEEEVEEEYEEVLFRLSNNIQFRLQTQSTIPVTYTTYVRPFYNFPFNNGRFIIFFFAFPYIYVFVYVCVLVCVYLCECKHCATGIESLEKRHSRIIKSASRVIRWTLNNDIWLIVGFHCWFINKFVRQTFAVSRKFIFTFAVTWGDLLCLTSCYCAYCRCCRNLILWHFY